MEAPKPPPVCMSCLADSVWPGSAGWAQLQHAWAAPQPLRFPGALSCSASAAMSGWVAAAAAVSPARERLEKSHLGREQGGMCTGQRQPGKAVVGNLAVKQSVCWRMGWQEEDN